MQLQHSRSLSLSLSLSLFSLSLFTLLFSSPQERGHCKDCFSVRPLRGRERDRNRKRRTKEVTVTVTVTPTSAMSISVAFFLLPLLLALCSAEEESSGESAVVAFSHSNHVGVVSSPSSSDSLFGHLTAISAICDDGQGGIFLADYEGGSASIHRTRTKGEGNGTVAIQGATFQGGLVWG